MKRLYLTKVWVGRHWRYTHTKRSYNWIWRKCGIVSYRRSR